MATVMVMTVDERRVHYRILATPDDVLKADTAVALHLRRWKAWAWFTIYDQGNVLGAHGGRVSPLVWPELFASMPDGAIVLTTKGSLAVSAARLKYEQTVKRETGSGAPYPDPRNRDLILPHPFGCDCTSCEHFRAEEGS